MSDVLTAPSTALDASVMEKVLPLTITFIDDSKGSPLLLREGAQPEEVTVGYTLNLGEMLYTRNSRVEMQDKYGMVMRLLENSEISIPNFEELGHVHALKWTGKVFKTRYYTDDNYIIAGQACGKSSGSCWVLCGSNVITEEVDSAHEVYYVLKDKTMVYEYDEKFERFDIVDIPEYYKAVLHFDDTKLMRERYTVVSVEPMSSEDWDYVSQTYLNKGKWL